MTQNRSTPVFSSNRRFALLVLSAICCAQIALLAGCHRGFYRRQADAEVRRLVAEKANSPRWDSVTGDIAVDPASRMFDPFSADHPPIPPDDPTSHKLMHQVDGKPGYPHWHANGDATVVESPYWRSYLPRNDKGEVLLSLSSAYQLALINSTVLQQQRETLYSSALDVSLQRFGFDTQLFSGFNSFLQSAGRFQSPTGQSSTTLTSQLGANGEGLSASRLGITGTNFVVGLANTILWEFSGSNTQSATSLIDFSIVQPLLRGAGRERILESLTQSERTLLGNVRQLERFRRGFYLQVATGRAPGAGPSLNANAFLNAPGLAGANVGGYMGLLLQQQTIRNLEFNVAQFETLLKQFRELFDKDRIDSLQVAQFESSVYTQQESLLNARINYQSSLDAFKVLLGLPPDLEVVIEDPFLDHFELIDDSFSERLVEIKSLREETSLPVVRLSDALRDFRVATDAGDDGDTASLKQRTADLKPVLKQASELVEKIISEDRGLVEQDLIQLEEVREQRISYLDQVREDIQSGVLESQVEPRVFTGQSVPTREELTLQLDDDSNQRALLQQLKSIQKEIQYLVSKADSPEELDGDPGDSLARRIENSYAKRVPDLLTEVDGVILEMALISAAARTNVIEINDVAIDADKAFETARCLRRDWMNARSNLVDRWRQIEFFADQLESEVDLVLTGEIGNVGDNPFRIRYENGNISAGFRFDSPLVRQGERNDYREALIDYQQARRDYYQFEDSINQSLRQTIRTIQQDKLLFELNRQNIQVNINAVQLARARLVEPPRIGQTGGLSDVTAQNLTFALNTLTNVQNRYLSLWLEYEVLRRNLDFDMGTMQLDEMYEWIDPGFIDGSIGAITAARDGIAENDANCCGMFAAQIPMGFMEPDVVNQTGEPIEESEATDDAEVTPDDDSIIDPPAEETPGQEVSELEFEFEQPVETVQPPSPQPVQELSLPTEVLPTEQSPVELVPVEQVPVPEPPKFDESPGSLSKKLLPGSTPEPAGKQLQQVTFRPLPANGDVMKLKPLIRISARGPDKAKAAGSARRKLSADPSLKRKQTAQEFEGLRRSQKLLEALRPRKEPNFSPLPRAYWQYQNPPSPR